MTLTEFLLARIAEKEQGARHDIAGAMTGYRWKHYPREAYEELQRVIIAHNRDVLVECEAKRQIIKLHEAWPVLVETPPSFESVNKVGSGYTDQIVFRASQQIAWTTQQEYRVRFGDEPPSAPMLRALALPYAGHPDFREEWRP